MRAISLAALTSLFLTGAAQAATMTFAGLPDWDVVEPPYPSSYTENGITASVLPDEQGDLASFFTPGAAHLDDSGTSFPSALEFTAGGVFAALSFDLLGLGFDTCDWGDEPCKPMTFSNVLVTGFLGGAAVAEESFAMPGFLQWRTRTLGMAFASIDRLVIGFAPIPFDCPGAPCTHFDLDNLRIGAEGSFGAVSSTYLAPVPVPASGGLLVLALVGAVALRRTRRR